jgi:hypothetical protein
LYLRSSPGVTCLSPRTASSEKKEVWSWESYLEEQKAITAPVSLFQDVSWEISTLEELVFLVQGLTAKLRPSGVFCLTFLNGLAEWKKERLAR